METLKNVIAEVIRTNHLFPEMEFITEANSQYFYISVLPIGCDRKILMTDETNTENQIIDVDTDEEKITEAVEKWFTKISGYTPNRNGLNTSVIVTSYIYRSFTESAV